MCVSVCWINFTYQTRNYCKLILSILLTIRRCLYPGDRDALLDVHESKSRIDISSRFWSLCIKMCVLGFCFVEVEVVAWGKRPVDKVILIDWQQEDRRKKKKYVS